MIDPRQIRTVFMGTPEFALPTLEGSARRRAPSGRRLYPARPAEWARQAADAAAGQAAGALPHGIPVFQPLKLRAPEVVEELRPLAPDLIVVVAFGQILPKSVLDIPSYGCINVHASLLPKYRGAAPINQAIIDGETETGVTTMSWMSASIPATCWSSRSTPIGPEETAGELHDRLALLGREAMEETLDRLCAGTLSRETQDDALSCYAPMLKKEDGRIDWRRAGDRDPQPGARPRSLAGGLYLAWPANRSSSPAPARWRAGRRPYRERLSAADRDGVRIACGDGVLRIGELQLPGQKAPARRRISARPSPSGRHPFAILMIAGSPPANRPNRANVSSSALLTVACAGILLLAFLLWWVPSVGLLQIHPLLPLVFGNIARRRSPWLPSAASACLSSPCSPAATSSFPNVCAASSSTTFFQASLPLAGWWASTATRCSSRSSPLTTNWCARRSCGWPPVRR